MKLFGNNNNNNNIIKINKGICFIHFTAGGGHWIAWLSMAKLCPSSPGSSKYYIMIINNFSKKEKENEASNPGKKEQKTLEA